MINNFLDDIRLSLDGSSAKDLILSTKTNDRFCAALKKGTESRTVLDSMICRYALYILGKCSEEALFPFSILSEPGSLAPNSYQRPLENELCIQDGNAGPGFVVNLPCSKSPKETTAAVDLIFREAFEGTPEESKAKAESHMRV
ncbi:MAG: hypothetical protein KDK48_06795, partial [Chlamydiia bacterium]|nr:hypothetical protein [Chlamydiia bacterium]